MQSTLENVATVWWESANRREIRWATVTAWCFGAGNATDDDDWWTLYDLADARIPEDWERAA